MERSKLVINEIPSASSGCDRDALFGSPFAERFGAEASLATHSQFASGEFFGITRVTSPKAMTEPTTAFPTDKALVISVSLCEIPHRSYQFWTDSKFRDVPHLRKFTTSVTDMESSPVCLVKTPFDYLHFYMPHALTAGVASDLGVCPVSVFRCCLAESDPVLTQAARLCTGTVEPSAIECDWLGLMLAAHLLKNYAGTTSFPVRRRSGLAVWQKKAATDYLRANLHRDVLLSEVSAVCSLSSSHFARAFKISFGRSVTCWIADARLALAKSLLGQPRVSLLEVSSNCGFRGQAAFTRWFSRHAGASPGVWRRSIPASL